MKQTALQLLIILFSVQQIAAQRVGINTEMPVTTLHVDLGSNASNGILFTGQDITGGSFPSLGAGHRFMYYPSKDALRAGFVEGPHWDNAFVGSLSTAFGYNTIAIAPGSFATGDNTRAAGFISSAFGSGTLAKGYCSVALGMFNDSVLTVNQDAPSPNTPLLMIGNGDGYSTRHNAMVVYKNGNMILKNPEPFYTTKLPESYSIPINGVGTRLMWLPELSAFRVGTVFDTVWDADNIGIGSFASGVNSMASGGGSTATGFDTQASGELSTAMGLGNKSKAYSSLAVGIYNDPIVAVDEEVSSPITPLFIIGNGDDDDNRKNAVVVRKDGNVGIGTNEPSATLHVNGTMQLADGSQGAGKILTSDINGLASWQPPPSSSSTYYQSVNICCQSWMAKNLDVSTYRNGDAIPKVTNDAAWAALTTGAYCYYDNDSTTYAATYGKLYNSYAVNDPRGLAPEGWHIPTYHEMITMSACLGGDDVSGGPMKVTGTMHWTSPNTGATNIAGLDGLPGGLRSIYGSFVEEGGFGFWWSSTKAISGELWYWSLYYLNDNFYKFDGEPTVGMSIRCVKD